MFKHSSSLVVKLNILSISGQKNINCISSILSQHLQTLYYIGSGTLDVEILTPKLFSGKYSIASNIEHALKIYYTQVPPDHSSI